MSKLVAIVGPTASGKSALAMGLAKKYGGEIICADSRTIYKGFNIGTAKPSKQDQLEVPHHLLDICEPGESFSVAQFKVLAEAIIHDIWARGKVPLLVGGSGMYMDAVLFDYQFRGSDEANREDFKDLTLTQLQSKARTAYPADYDTIDHHNRLRLEQILQRGMANNNDRARLRYDCLILGIATERPIIKQNIESRVEQMMNNGFVQEVEGIIKEYGKDCPQLEIIGYRHARSFLRGDITGQQLKERFIRDDLALAKRQLTWFKRNIFIRWLVGEVDPKALVDEYLAC